MHFVVAQEIELVQLGRDGNSVRVILVFGINRVSAEIPFEVQLEVSVRGLREKRNGRGCRPC